ncbi:zinc ribbon domain-containing protein [Chitinophaga nivalis]|uniref:Zinc ribbon domain-containing protein n=1 Tax=Chitinophaga nivalis TaxID=2991709 RepID=A0ABT3IGM6_9BACT|nr:zinc ribbon domain-containing protein [Chitinophaga nivalis]MCW3467190.1 zinc ribbon domain-containing protein [Chitinophaga nivalis]MCW3483118.1 zinc ribbon domain-containing protein [Chitinophaga nivalis]
MFIIYGRKIANIKTDTNQAHDCKSCHDFDLEIKVYREYFHVFFLPVFPIGCKEVKIRCNNCGEPKWIASLQQQYEKSVRTPFYLYTWLIMLAGLVVFAIVANLNTQKEKAQFVADPHVGDVYTIQQDEKGVTNYYFLKVSKMNGDTIWTYHSNLVYTRYVSRFSEDDFFVKQEEIRLTKKELKEMLDKDEINGVDRDYGIDEGFNRVQ